MRDCLYENILNFLVWKRIHTSDCKLYHYNKRKAYIKLGFSLTAYVNFKHKPTSTHRHRQTDIHTHQQTHTLGNLVPSNTLRNLLEA